MQVRMQFVTTTHVMRYRLTTREIVSKRIDCRSAKEKRQMAERREKKRQEWLELFEPHELVAIGFYETPPSLN